MKNGLTKFSEKIGFTETEIKVISFLIVIFSIGFGYKFFFIDNNQAVYKYFDYSNQDSAFYSVIKNNNRKKLKKGNISNQVDYKQEVSDFNKSKVIKNKTIEINKANIKTLVTIPGIGKKTAENIIKYRTDHNGIKKLNDLLKIKGIGKIKFTKIKKYLYIEK